MHMITKPDIDNLEKKVLDVLSKIVYNDDKQIYEIHSRKLYGVNPKTVICVKPYNYERLDATFEGKKQKSYIRKYFRVTPLRTTRETGCGDRAV